MNSQLLSPAAIVFAITAAISILGLYRMPNLIGRLVVRPGTVA